MESIAQKQALINVRVLLDNAAFYRSRAKEQRYPSDTFALSLYAEACERDARAELARARGG